MIVEVAGVSVRWIKSVMKEVAGSNAVVSTVVSTRVETAGVVVAPSKTSVAAEAGGVVTDRTVVVKRLLGRDWVAVLMACECRDQYKSLAARGKNAPWRW